MKGVYKIVNTDNEIYIGGTTNISKRLTQYRHGKGQSRLMQASIEKHGWASHLFEVVHELPVDVSQETLDTYEQLYIDLYKDCGVVLLNLKGAGRYGKHGVNTKIKMSASATGKILSDEHKKNMSIAQTGRKHPEEVKLKIAEGNRGKKYSNETRNKMRTAKLGKKVSEETKRKTSLSVRGGKHPGAKKVIDTNSGEIYAYVGDAASAIGINRGTLTDYLNGKSPNKTTLKYL